jgi:hypothetical protein
MLVVLVMLVSSTSVLSLSSAVHYTPAVLALLAYVGAGLGYMLVAGGSGDENANEGPCCSELSHYLDTHTVSGRIERALRDGRIAVGMVRRQVSLIRGVPRTRFHENGNTVWVYDGKEAQTPAWLLVIFESRRVASVRRVSVAERPALPFQKQRE